MAVENLRIIAATGNRDKQNYLANAFTHIDGADIQVLSEEIPPPEEIGTEANRSFIKAMAYQEAAGGEPALGWDDGIYVVLNGIRTEFPGADVKPFITAVNGSKPSKSELLQAFAKFFEQLEGEYHIVYKRAFCLVDRLGAPIYTTWEQAAEIDLGSRDAEIMDYPTSHIAIPHGFSHAFAQFTPEEETRYNVLLASMIEGIVCEMTSRSQGHKTDRAFDFKGRTWVFTNPLTRAKEENGIITIWREKMSDVTILDQYTDLDTEARLMAEALEIDPQNIQLNVE